jgi:hypothetical protein
VFSLSHLRNCEWLLRRLRADVCVNFPMFVYILTPSCVDVCVCVCICVKVSAIIHEVRALDAVILDGAGVGTGAHTAKLWEDKKAAAEVILYNVVWLCYMHVASFCF